MFLKRDFICGLAYKQLMKQGKDAYSSPIRTDIVFPILYVVYNRFLTFWIYKHEPWSYPPCMVNPHCDPDWFLLRRTSIGPSLILNTFRRKKKTAADLKIWFVFYASRQGVVISISPEHNSPSLQPPCKHTAYVRRIYIGSDASTGECQQRMMSSVPLSAPCPVVLWTVTNSTLTENWNINLFRHLKERS